ncbi:MAG: quinone-dependent dihydroorotate dehydrogenase [Planctomycetota bacterium]
MNLWRNLIRPLAFCLPAERAHYMSMGLFSGLSTGPVASILRRRYQVEDRRLSTELFGLQFSNPVGLAAGFDKDARWPHKLELLGFSHVEIGTVTGKSQSGNPQPRLFRLKTDHALINRMGFNNSGADAAARRLSMTPALHSAVLGVNIGKTKVVPVEEATSDYLFSFERLYAYADYFTVNVSSPNTPGLRSLQNREPLIELLSSLAQKNRELAADHESKPKPILLKIAPDVTEEQLDDIVQIAQEIPVSGIIATNTTISRDGLNTPAATVETIGAGGLSGSPLTKRSREVVARLYSSLGGTIPIVGVGGIMSGEHAWQMICSGASLIQVYTGFIYAGPGIVRDINRYLIRKLDESGMSSIAEAVGSAAD